MNSSKNPNSPSTVLPAITQAPGSIQGSVMVYLIVVILIFGVLGVTIVSLFTTATSSSATPNDSRRAFYLAESGKRFAASELREHNFDGITIGALNSTTYTLNEGGSFNINAFSPWFKSQEDFSAGSNLEIKIPVGEIPNTFLIDSTDEIVNFTLINFDFVIAIPDTGEAVIQSYSNRTATSIELNLGADTFVANKGEIICLAVHPTSAGALTDGGNLEVSLAARDYFPPRSGAIYLVAANSPTGPTEGDYFYENRVDDPANNKVILTNITKLPASPAFPINLATTDYVILSPRNYTIITSGTSGDVTYGGDMGYALNIYDTGIIPRNPDIDAEKLTDNIEEVETDTGFIGVDTGNDTLNIGGGAAGPDFGAAWFNADMSIGGQTNFCQDGACLFGLGVRVFFIVETVSQGDGFTFALINSNNNDTASVGGDIDLGELMGYAGDSRKVSLPNTLSDFLDPAASLAEKGLLPPKMALEFDFYENSGVNDYCISGDNQGEQTRNDPTESLLVDTEAGETATHRDVLQYVYWGTTNLNITCKLDGNPTTYDDNRHDAAAAGTGIWEYPTDFPAAAEIGNVKSDPTVGPDGTIYFGSDDHYLYALNADGSKKWSANTGGAVQSSPTIDDRGTTGPGNYADDVIYVGSNSYNLHAFDFNGNELWTFDTGGNVRTKPALGPMPTRMVYLGSDGAKFLALNPADRQQDYSTPGSRPFPQATEWAYSTADNNWIKSSAAVDDNDTPADISDDTIYVGTDEDYIYGFNQGDRAADLTAGDDTFPTANEWRFDTGGNAQAGPAIGADGTIYVGADCCDFWSFNQDDRADGLTFPTANEWEYPGVGVIDDVRGAPALADDGTIYFGAAAGSDNGKVYALNPAGNLLWDFDTKGEVFTRPALSPDENTIYVGTEKNKVYALNKTDRLNGEDFPSENEWEFTADGKVRAPAVSPDGTVVYVGSEGGLLYALDFAEPINERSTLISYSDEFRLDSEPAPTQDEQDNWLKYNDYAVRLEVMRSREANPDGKYEYTLHTWVRRCEFDDCTDTDITGTFFQDTRVQYAWFPSSISFMNQTVKLEASDHNKFERLLFGFTGATGETGAQSVLIKDFQLSFIRPNDPIVTDDSTNYPIPP